MSLIYNLTHRIEPFFWIWHREIHFCFWTCLKFIDFHRKIWRKGLNSFFLKIWLKELNLFCSIWLKDFSFLFSWLKYLNLFHMTQRISTFFFSNFRLKELKFFWVWLNELNVLKIWLTELNLHFLSWLKELNSFCIWLKELNLFLNDSKNWTFLFSLKNWTLSYLNLAQRLEFFFEYDSKNWIFLTQRMNFFGKNSQRIEHLLDITQRIELFFFQNMTQRTEPSCFAQFDPEMFLLFFMTQILEPFSHDSKNWTFFFTRLNPFYYVFKNWTFLKILDSKISWIEPFFNTTHRYWISLNTTHRIEPYIFEKYDSSEKNPFLGIRLTEIRLFLNVTQRIEPFNVLNMTQRTEPFSFFKIWPKEIEFFCWMWVQELNFSFEKYESKNWIPCLKYDSKNWTLLLIWIWLKELKLFFKRCYSKNWTHFFQNDHQRIEPILSGSMSQRIELFFCFEKKNGTSFCWIWLEELNTLFPDNMTQRIELFWKKNCGSKSRNFFHMILIIEPVPIFSKIWLKALHLLIFLTMKWGLKGLNFFRVWLKKMNSFLDMTHIIEPSFFGYVTERNEPFLWVWFIKWNPFLSWIWLKELNSFVNLTHKNWTSFFRFE